jgi:hypothetical protein
MLWVCKIDDSYIGGCNKLSAQYHTTGFIHPFTSTLLVLIMVPAHETAWFEHSFERSMDDIYGRLLRCMPVAVPWYWNIRYCTRYKVKVNQRRSTCASSAPPAATSAIGSITVPQYIYSTIFPKASESSSGVGGHWPSENVETRNEDPGREKNFYI